MQINSETLKKLRNKNGFSQQTLADESGVAKKTIARIESGKEKGEPRGGTVKLLAKALNIKPEVLAEAPESETVREQELQKYGLRPIKLVLDGETILAYGLVAEQYGVETREIIKAAPLLFTLLAEQSLAARRRRLEQAEEALGAFPEHLIPRSWSALDAERASIGQRDIFTRHIDDHEISESYYEEERNPFSDFLVHLAKELGPDNDALDHEEIHNLGNFDGLPSFSIFETYRRKNLTGGSSRADYALSRGYVSISQIPVKYFGEDESVVSERVKFLEGKVSDEDWAEYKSWIDSLNLSFDVDESSKEGDENV